MNTRVSLGLWFVLGPAAVFGQTSTPSAESLNSFFDQSTIQPETAAVPTFMGSLSAQPIEGTATAATIARTTEIPAPSAKELPDTFTEFRRATDSRLPGWLRKLLDWLKLPVEAAKMLAAEILTRPEGGWDEIAGRLEAEVGTIVSQSGPASFESPAFVQAFETTLGTKFIQGGKVEPLVDGPASFQKRFDLIDKARSTIHILSWALYDDETGYLTARKLVAKAREGVKVRVIVDEQISEQEGKGGRLFAYLEAAGIMVVRWRSPRSERRYHGQHRKILIVDGATAVAGGMNFGDDYSHLGNSTMWRDTDALIEGPAVAETERLFADVWNEQIARIEEGLDAVETARRRSQGYTPLPEPFKAPAASEGPRIALIDHVPGDNDNGLKSILLAVEAARSSIDIENAYFIMDPAVQRALARAKERGVTVRILTNSSESVDEPIVTYPILKSAEAARREGLEVYLKKGSTLHSKFMIVDDIYAWVGSYNLQPRSALMENEVIVGVLDRAFAAKMRAVFENDIAAAQKVTDPVALPRSLFSRIAYLFFYNQL